MFQVPFHWRFSLHDSPGNHPHGIQNRESQNQKSRSHLPAGKNSERREKITDKHASRVPHKNFCRIEIKKPESQCAGEKNNAHHGNGSLRSKIVMYFGTDTQKEKSECRNDSHTARQAVQPVQPVHGVHNGDNPQYRKKSGKDRDGINVVKRQLNGKRVQDDRPTHRIGNRGNANAGKNKYQCRQNLYAQSQPRTQPEHVVQKTDTRHKRCAKQNAPQHRVRL
ncbi:MAG TPA: hypothetical protein VI588_01710, partial [Candidatus Gracilibacteria bacterium]|nr:hypothetical protein [Candidatus Gracilibacteria bacterium]